MKRIFALLLALGAVGSLLVLAQTNEQLNFAVAWPGSWQFHVGGAAYEATISQKAVLDSPSWSPSQPLPLTLARVEEIARQELRRLVDDDSKWEPTDFSLHRLKGATPPKWFYVVEFMPAKNTRDHFINGRYDTVRVLVNTSGSPGTFSPLPRKTQQQ